VFTLEGGFLEERGKQLSGLIKCFDVHQCFFSVTRVIVTEDCIEAEEFIDDEAESSSFISSTAKEYSDKEAKEVESSMISYGTELARKLFSDESEISSM